MTDSPYPQPLFILAAPRSFTSLVCAMLGQNPQTYGVPELNLFISDTLQELLEKLTGYSQIQLHGLVRTVAHLYAGEQTLTSVDMARRWMLTRLDHSTREIYQELCRKVVPLRIVDKSPVYCHKPEYLERLREAFPNASYLHLVRHPRTQCVSLMKVAKGLMAVLVDSIDYATDPPTVDPQILWHMTQRNILDFLEDVPGHAQIRMRGEDIVADPSTQLRSICNWMGVRDDADAVEAMLHPEESPYSNLGPLGAHLGNDTNFLRAPALRPTTIPDVSLDGALPWRTDEQGFSDEVKAMATQFGYT